MTCNAICPGWVLTPLVQKQIDDRAAHEGIEAAQAKYEVLAEKQPSHEFVTPEQLGAFAIFLCSDAASQIRGQALSDGRRLDRSVTVPIGGHAERSPPPKPSRHPERRRVVHLGLYRDRLRRAHRG